MFRYVVAIFLALVTTVCFLAEAKTAENITAGISRETDWREDYAYIVGMQAYIYGYPALRYTRDRYYMVEKPSGIIQIRVNEFFHVTRLADSSDKYSNSPNNDTIYSLSWIDLSDEPVVMHAPQGDGRYVDIELADFYSDVFGYVSPHMHDGKAVTYLIVGPKWDGPIPEGQFDGVLRAPTPWVWTVARVYTSGGDDLAIARVGLGPLATVSLDDLDENTRRGLVRALKDGNALLDKLADAGGDTKVVNNSICSSDFTCPINQ